MGIYGGGGRQGGFIAAHCSARYPDLFKVVAVLDPIVDVIASSYDDDEFFRHPPEDEMKRMRDASPIMYVGNVIAPMLVTLTTSTSTSGGYYDDGRRRLRCHPSVWSLSSSGQGSEWYRSLQLKGYVPTRLLAYYDNDDDDDDDNDREG